MKNINSTWRIHLGTSLVLGGTCVAAFFMATAQKPGTPETPILEPLQLQDVVPSLAPGMINAPMETLAHSEPAPRSIQESAILSVPNPFQSHEFEEDVTQNLGIKPNQVPDPVATQLAGASHDLEFEADITAILAESVTSLSIAQTAGASSSSRPRRAWNREQASSALARAADSAKSAAWARARAEGWEPIGTLPDDAGGYELMALQHDVVYMYQTDNADAGISANTTAAMAAAPMPVNGSSVTVGIWDQGAALTSHQELVGRVTIKDDAYPVSHATHAGGTIIARGTVVDAKGMAPGARLDTYNWTSDLSEMTDAAMSTPEEAGKIQVSSHSYGYITGWANTYSPARWYGEWGQSESSYFGLYDWYAREWDKLCYNTRYYLPFKSAGNNRTDHAPYAGTTFKYYDGGWKTKTYNPATDPKSDGLFNNGFDTIPMIGNAKNVMTVGAVDDAVSNGNRDLSKASMTSFSGWGPADDGRIKPDVVASGLLVYSSKASANNAYGNMSGTSMSTPSAAGAAALLLDCYNNFFPGQSLLASSLKGLIIHSADDLGNPGPDYKYGWGHVNAEAALQVMQAHHQDVDAGQLRVHDIYPGETQTFTYQVSGSEDLKVTIAWTDPEGDYSYTLDDRSARLVNDLNLRIIGPDGDVHLPFVLDPENPSAVATTGVNDRDNVEQVIVAVDQPGIYQVQIAAPAVLSDNVQEYSVIVSGGSTAAEEPPAVTLSAASQDTLDATGLVRIDGVVADTDSEFVALEVGYSMDNGASWNGALLDSAENESGALLVDNDQETQVPSMALAGSSSFVLQWDTMHSAVPVLYSDETRVRVRAWDGANWSDWSESAAFVVDNQGPDVSGLDVKVASGWAFDRYVVIPEVTVSFTNTAADVSNIAGYRYGTDEDPVASIFTTDFMFTVDGLAQGAVNQIYIWAENHEGRVSEAIVLDVYVLAYPGEWDGTSALEGDQARQASSVGEDVPFAVQVSASAGVPILRFPYQAGKDHTIEAIATLDGISGWQAVPDVSYTIDDGWIVWVNDPAAEAGAPDYEFFRVRAE